ncbi:MAG TPA: AAA family ATPase [Solirubrobacter sp.]|nr:AAA family ATPase [Solirubrobacter sp.]
MSEPRSVRIGDDERGGWSSDRPRRAGGAERPPRKADVSVRGRVLAPTDRIRYSPGSLVVIACADRALRDRFAARVVEEQSAVLSLDKVRALLQGRVPSGELEQKAQALLDAAATKRFAAGQSVVIPLETLSADERERYVRLAHAHRRARHIVLVEAGKDAVAEEDRDALTRLRTALDAGELGLDGFMTSLRLGGRMVDELKRIVFAPPPADE